MHANSTQSLKVLLVEDDVALGERVKAYAATHAIDATLVDNIAGTRMLLKQHRFDVVVLDLMLVDGDGMTLARELVAQNGPPVLITSARIEEADRVLGLELGAEDYLVKPYAFSELNARVNALARRPPASKEITVLRVGDLEMNLLKRTVTRNGEVVDLQPREFQLLEYLMRRADQIVTRTMLLEGVWDFHFDPKTNIVETHISRLRTKLNQGRDTHLIHTVRGSGYCLRAPATAD